MVLMTAIGFFIEDAMIPKFDFLTHQSQQMISQHQNNMKIDKYRTQEPGLRGRMIDLLGDVMISGGMWLKKSSKPQSDD